MLLALDSTMGQAKVQRKAYYLALHGRERKHCIVVMHPGFVETSSLDTVGLYLGRALSLAYNAGESRRNDRCPYVHKTVQALQDI
jgi:hypothetical protein